MDFLLLLVKKRPRIRQNWGFRGRMEGRGCRCLLLLALLQGAAASCEWNRLEKEMTCDLR